MNKSRKYQPLTHGAKRACGVELAALDAPCEKNGTRHGSMYEMWGLTKEVEAWGYAMPTAKDLGDVLFEREPIEWNRIGML